MKTTHMPTRIASKRGGFTLVELSVVIVVIVILISLVMVAAGRALRDSRVAAERLLLVSLNQAVEQFKQQFGFPPPLVNDDIDDPPMNPGTNPIWPDPNTAYIRPRVRDSAFLRSERRPDEPRYSEYSLPYYLIGVLDSDDMSSGNPPIDGVAGPGFTRPNEDGTFSRKGQTFAPFVDAGVRKRLVTENAAQGRIEIVDRWYVPNANWPAIRYYRWLPKTDNNGKVVQYLVPFTVGDPNLPEKQDLRNATFAIVSLGPDGQTNPRKPVPLGNVAGGPEVGPPRPLPGQPPDPMDVYIKDDIVETGS